MRHLQSRAAGRLRSMAEAAASHVLALERGKEGLLIPVRKPDGARNAKKYHLRARTILFAPAPVHHPRTSRGRAMYGHDNRIFVSYRRAETGHVAGRLADLLIERV